MNKILLVAATAVIALASAACSRAPANQQVLVSDNCGQDWRLIVVGDVVPAGTPGNTCYQKIEVPNYPMAGESTFRATFSDRVRVGANSSYDYSITDAIKFIPYARFIASGSASGNSTVDASKWDTAESILIDRQLREVANSAEFLLAEDIVEFNQGEFEDRLLIKLNEVLAERGIQLNTFTFVVTPDDQTRNMIDVAAAMRVCTTIETMSKETCEAILTARAGAARVTVGATGVE